MADFAKSSPERFLLSTEQAVGSEALTENHKKLIDGQAKSERLKSALKFIESNKNKGTQQNEHLLAELIKCDQSLSQHYLNRNI